MARLASSSLGLRHANPRVALSAADKLVGGLRRAQSQPERRCTQLQREVVQLSQSIRRNNEKIVRARALLERSPESETETERGQNPPQKNADAFETKTREIRAETAANERTRSRLESQRAAIRAQTAFAEQRAAARAPEVEQVEAENALLAQKEA